MNYYPWQESTWHKILKAKKQQRLPHALLLHGHSGAGKLAFAEQLTASLLCETKADVACGTCQGCKLFIAGSHPDLVKLIVSQEEIIKVDQIREIEAKLKLTAQNGQNKIALIYPAENMNQNAANSLLKTLEEPAADSILILISHASQKLLPTIKSRCQQLFMPVPSHAEALSWLQEHKVDNDPELLLQISGGAPELALNLDSKYMLAQYQEFIQDLKKLSSGQLDPVRFSKKIQSSNLSLVLNWLLHITSTRISTKARQNQFTDFRAWFGFYDRLLKAKAYINSSVNQRLILDEIFISYQELT